MRHGQTAANEAHIFCGRLDPPLSPRGEAQVRRAAQALQGPFDRVLISPALRTRQTAKIVCPDVEPEVLPELRELDFGDFEGLTADEIRDRMPEAWANYMNIPLHFIFPNGDDTVLYLREAERTIQRIALGEGRVLIVSHRGFTTAALSTLLHGDASRKFSYSIAPAGVAELEVSEGFALLKQLRNV